LEVFALKYDFVVTQKAPSVSALIYATLYPFGHLREHDALKLGHVMRIGFHFNEHHSLASVVPQDEVQITHHECCF
jgi:hypothetical protein